VSPPLAVPHGNVSAGQNIAERHAMSIIRRLAIIAAAIALALGMGGMTVGAGAATTVAAVSHAQAGTRSASPDFTCSGGDTCVFTGDDWNGTYNEETNLYLSSSCAVSDKTWCSFSQYFNGLARPGSLTVAPGSAGGDWHLDAARLAGGRSLHDSSPARPVTVDDSKRVLP
jgi:hypothetical protein